LLPGAQKVPKTLISKFGAVRCLAFYLKFILIISRLPRTHKIPTYQNSSFLFLILRVRFIWVWSAFQSTLNLCIWS